MGPKTRKLCERERTSWTPQINLHDVLQEYDDDDVYSESDEGEDIYVDGDNSNNNNGYYNPTVEPGPNLNGGGQGQGGSGPGGGRGRDRGQQPPRQRSPSASFFAQPGTLAGNNPYLIVCADKSAEHENEDERFVQKAVYQKE